MCSSGILGQSQKHCFTYQVLKPWFQVNLSEWSRYKYIPKYLDKWIHCMRLFNMKQTIRLLQTTLTLVRMFYLLIHLYSKYFQSVLHETYTMVGIGIQILREN